jgi:hypothetical protein
MIGGMLKQKPWLPVLSIDQPANPMICSPCFVAPLNLKNLPPPHAVRTLTPSPWPRMRSLILDLPFSI